MAGRRELLEMKLPDRKPCLFPKMLARRGSKMRAVFLGHPPGSSFIRMRRPLRLASCDLGLNVTIADDLELDGGADIIQTRPNREFGFKDNADVHT